MEEQYPEREKHRNETENDFVHEPARITRFESSHGHVAMQTTLFSSRGRARDPRSSWDRPSYSGFERKLHANAMTAWRIRGGAQILV